MNNEAVKDQLKHIPNQPGVYRYYDKKGTVLYIGKARNLKKRVSSYFTKKHDSARLTMLVRKIDKIEFTIVTSEQEALLLENSLIKKYQPKYNIQLKDDKSYPFICIKNERFPRVFLTRKHIQDGSLYLGPYTSVRKADTILEMLKNLFPLRNCNYNLSTENIEAGKFKVCLEYHLGNCLGPCENLQTEKDYNEGIEQIKRILMGKSSLVLSDLKTRMKQAADDYEFELANELKTKIDILTNYNARTAIVHPTIEDVDVFTMAKADNVAFINYLRIVNGSIIQTKSLEIKNQLDETDEEIMLYAIAEVKDQLKSAAPEIIVPFDIEYPDERVKITVPKIGDKKKLVDLSYKNAFFMKSRYIEEKNKRQTKSARNRTLEQIQNDFRLKELPVHIECFDNSNFQGTNPVASMVVFKNAKPAKKDYRHYNIKTVEGPNDFASMEEVVYRRYKRLLDEQKPLPQLIIIDGGKGQLSSAVEGLKKAGAWGKLAVASIAKKLEEIYFPGDSVPLHISKQSESLKVIQHLRNEAHRFAITFHRSKRMKSTLKTSLADIQGIGPKTSETLLKALRSEQKIKQASLEELALLIGKTKAQLVFDHYH